MVIYIFIYQTNTYTLALTLTLTLTLTLLLAIITAIQWKYNGALRKQWESTQTHVCCSKPPGLLSLESHSSQGAAGQLLCGCGMLQRQRWLGVATDFAVFCLQRQGVRADLQAGWHVWPASLLLSGNLAGISAARFPDQRLHITLIIANLTTMV